MLSQTPRSTTSRIHPTQPDAAYREEFLRVLACLQVDRASGIALAEAATGRPFETCLPTHLVPLLQQLLEVLPAPRTPKEASQP
jgi:hypothetical protein